MVQSLKAFIDNIERDFSLSSLRLKINSHASQKNTNAGIVTVIFIVLGQKTNNSLGEGHVPGREKQGLDHALNKLIDLMLGPKSSRT